MLTLIEGAEVFSPAPLGQQDLLVADGRIATSRSWRPSAVGP